MHGKRFQQLLAACARHTAASHLRRHKREEPLAVTRDQQPAYDSSSHHHRQRDADVEPDFAYRPAPSTEQETAQPGPQPLAWAINLEPGPLHQ